VRTASRRQRAALRRAQGERAENGEKQQGGLVDSSTSQLGKTRGSGQRTENGEYRGGV
jgi:hypothetical protein